MGNVGFILLCAAGVQVRALVRDEATAHPLCATRAWRWPSAPWRRQHEWPRVQRRRVAAWLGPHLGPQLDRHKAAPQELRRHYFNLKARKAKTPAHAWQARRPG